MPKHAHVGSDARCSGRSCILDSVHLELDLMNLVPILLTATALVLLGFLLFMVFRKWGTMSTPATMTLEVPVSIGDDLDAELQALVAQGKKIHAIKLVRELTGLGLKESKDYVDRLPHMPPLAEFVANPRPSMPTAAIEQEIRQLLLHRQKIEAIKRVRELTGMGLKEAKDYVESL
jgi:ribosomal protein L7/L12